MYLYVCSISVCIPNLKQAFSAPLRNQVATSIKFEKITAKYLRWQLSSRLGDFDYLGKYKSRMSRSLNFVKQLHVS